MITVCNLVPVTIGEELATLVNIFFIFQKIPAWNWEALSHLYTQSPFLCLDAFHNNKGNSNNVKGNCDSSDKHGETSSKDYHKQS